MVRKDASAVKQIMSSRTSSFPSPVDDLLPAKREPGLSVGFLLLPGFTLMAFSGFVEVLRHAADQGDKGNQVLCRWKMMGVDRGTLSASCGLKVRPDSALVDPAEFDYLVVVGGQLPSPVDYDRRALDYVREAQAKGVGLIGVCTGSFVLARAGVMDRVRASVHWFHYNEFQELFPGSVPVTDEIFIVDKGIITCAGGTSTMDLALSLVSRYCGNARATKCLRHLISDQIRQANHPQIPLSGADSRLNDSKVRRAIFLMNQHIKEPLTIAEIADRANVGERQLSRLFLKHLETSPADYYRRIRLDHSCWLLQSTGYPVTQVAYETGFTDLSHFNKHFVQAFGLLPSKWRVERQTPTSIEV